MDNNTMNIILWVALIVIGFLYFKRRRDRKMKEWKQK